MLELYNHFLSTCSQKVRLVLAEKALDYEHHWVDLLKGEQHDPAYVKMNPNHVVPTLIHDGHVVIESTLINEYLQDAFPDPSTAPEDPKLRHQMRMWTKRIDQVHPHTGAITYGIGTRPVMLQRPPEEVEASIQAIPDPARREARRSVIEHGVKAPEIRAAIGQFVSLLDDMNAALAGSDFLAGDRYSLAEAALIPYILRLDTLAMTPLIDARPNVAAWYDRVRARGSYEAAVTAYLPEAFVAGIRSQGELVWKDVEAIAQEVSA